MLQLLLLVLVLVGIGLGIWAYVKTEPKKENKEDGNNNGGNGNGNNNGKSNNNGGNGPCKWKEYAGKDNDGVSPCDHDGCKLENTTEEECKKACCEMDQCKAVQWRSTDGRCLLKHSVGDIKDTAAEKTLYVKE